MFLIGTFVLCLSLSVGYGFDCRDLTGTWKNQLGSHMTIVHLTGNQITGEYNTAVETKQNAALNPSNITGLFVPLSDGALVSFTVIFNHGKSLTTWVGQCMVCDGEETLFTSWVLRSYTSKYSDKWMVNLVNQDTFKRVRDNRIEIPMEAQSLPPTEIRSFSCEKNLEAGVGGQWKSKSEDFLKFTKCHESGVLSGMNQDTPFVGRQDGRGHFTALGLVSAVSESIKGWTGHIYDTERHRTIETSWLSHSFSQSCRDPRGFVQYGTANYTLESVPTETTG